MHRALTKSGVTLVAMALRRMGDERRGMGRTSKRNMPGGLKRFWEVILPGFPETSHFHAGALNTYLATRDRADRTESQGLRSDIWAPR